jgi:uncharacterized protein YjbI with pentapeptide repeats
MANQEHVEILKDGVKAWNKWRKDNPDIKPDLMFLNIYDEAFKTSVLWHRAVRCFIEPLTKPHIDLADINFEETDLSGGMFSGVNLQSANLKNAQLAHADLSYSSLLCIKLEGSLLSEANLEGALLMQANLKNAHAEGTHLKGARLDSACLEGAFFTSANLSDANLTGANLKKTKLRGANLTNANLTSLNYTRPLGPYRGIRMDGCYGNEMFRREALHQAFIEEFRESGGRLTPAIYWVWDSFVDCGRSPWRLMKWIFAFWLLFAEMFFTLEFLWPQSFDIGELPNTIWTMLYYSIVTLTTLGFGDVTPLTYPAMIFVSMEVILGYIILGGLISFLSSKMVPRG